MKTSFFIPTLAPLLAIARVILGQPQPGTVLWTYQAPTAIVSSAALAQDGTVYIGAGAGLMAITNSGGIASNKWITSFYVESIPVVGPDGTVFCSGSLSGNLSAVNPDGALKWYYATPDGCGPPAFARDGTIYFDSYSYLYALTNSGGTVAVKWKAVVGDTAHYSCPVVAPDGTVYLASWDQYLLYAFNADGTKKWSRALETNPGEAPALGVDGTVYVTGGPLYAFTPDGTELWSTPIHFNMNGPPVLSKFGTIYVAGSGNHALNAFTPEGQSTWSALGAGSSVPGIAAAVDGSGMIYYSVSNSVWALSPQGQVQWAVTVPGLPLPGGYFATHAPIIGPDGIIYAPLGNTLYAIAGSGTPPDSSWPMFQQNSRHTGKVEKPALNPPKKRADANFEFQLYAQLGQTNVIETTTNLSTWTALTNVVITNVPMDVVDLSASNHPFRFYRSLVP